MIFAIGGFKPKDIFIGLKEMALGNNQLHERNVDKPFPHPDGWGAYFKQGKDFKVFKSIKSCFEDEKFMSVAKKVKSNYLFLHARKSTKTPRFLRNTHPFISDKFALFHNGSVKEELFFDEQYETKGNTDSEELLYFLASNFVPEKDFESIISALKKIKNFYKLNCFFITKDYVYVIVYYNKNPLLGDMKMFLSDKTIVVSSEIVHTIPVHSSRWSIIGNKSVLRVPLNFPEDKEIILRRF
jgi:predicted glutamine amidotransferase|tara:strand:- start:943 stop:1665 length:723 start_codon:yes stop_codon:yes gene_type:complete